MARAIALAFVLFVITAADAKATAFRVVVVPGLGLDDLPVLAGRGAVGLLVPGAGPETSGEAARAALVRGEARNSLRGPPTGPELIRLETASSIPDKAPVIVVGLPSGAAQSNNRRYPIAVIGDGYSGLLMSESTRIPGLISIADIAPSALGRGDRLGYEPDADAAESLLDLDARIDAHNESRLPASILAGTLVILLAILWPQAGLLGFAAAIGANLLLGVAAVSTPWAVMLVVGVAVAAGGPLLAFALRSDLALGLFLGGIVLAYLAALWVDGSTVALSPFGPTQNARFYGISNLLETMLLVPAFASATFLWRRLGWPGFAAAALLSFVLVAGNRFGADGGGAVVLAAGFALLGVLLAGVRGRILAAVLVGVAGVAAGLIALDAATGASSHLTRALRSGPGGLAADLRDRVELSWERFVHTPSVTVVVAVGLPMLILLSLRALRSGVPFEGRALPLAFAAAIGVSLLVNDSPNDVVAAGLVGYVSVEASMLRGRCAAASRSRSPLAFSWPWPVAAARRPSRLRPRP